MNELFLQFSSDAQLCPTLCNPVDCSTPGLPVHHQLLELTHSIKLVMPSNHLILCCPLLLSPSIFPSIRVFSNESLLCIRQPKYWGYRCQGPSIQMQKVLRVWMQGNTEKCISEVQNKYCSLALV